MQATDHYTIISADTHCGGSHADYREYLDPAFRDEFDAWRGKYKNPYKDLRDTDLKVRNWDSDRRWRDQEPDGVVAEVLFPNTIPPFFPRFVLFAPPPTPEQYPQRRAGIQAHNRWLVDFVAEAPERRAGIGQIFLNDVDDAIEDVKWIKEHGLRGGALLGPVPPDVDWVKPLYHPDYDPLWKVCEDLGVPLNVHGGTGTPSYGKFPFSMLIQFNEVSFYGQRPFIHMLLSGVFERFPDLQFVMTEQGAAWLPPVLERLDNTIRRIRDAGSVGELRFDADTLPQLTATEYFQRQCWLGVSQPGPADAAAREVVGSDRIMWGNDYPHDEGTHPFTREHLRAVFEGAEPDELQMILAGNAARLYDFDLDALKPLADQHGPTVAELSEPLVDLPENPNEALLKSVAA